jgi:hypothetical protein
VIDVLVPGQLLAGAIEHYKHNWNAMRSWSEPIPVLLVNANAAYVLPLAR